MEITIDMASGKVTLGVSGTFTAEQLRDLIQALCQARGQIASEPRNPVGLQIQVTPGAPWYTEPLAADPAQSLLFVLIKGWGWTGITLSSVDRLRLAGLLVGQHVVGMASSASASAADYHGHGGGGTLH